MATLVASYEKPIVAFSALRKDVNALGCLPRWAGIGGQNGSRDLEAAVLAFNRGELDGIALTFSVGCCGWRAEGAKTLVMIGTANSNVMAQAAARAPGATTVLL